MLINVPNEPGYSGLEKGDSIAVIQDGRVLGHGTIYHKYSSLVVLDVDSGIWKAFNLQLREKTFFKH